MRIVNYYAGSVSRAGIQVGETIVDASAVLRTAEIEAANGKESIQARELLSLLPKNQERLMEIANHLAERKVAGTAFQRKDVKLGPPIPDPDKIICLGLNYLDHAKEANLALPEAPMLFAKYRNSLAGPEDAVELPEITQVVDYEAELAVVIGKRGKNIPEAEALSYVAGVMALNDVSARDVQNRTSQWMAGKAIDTFAPCGPALVTLDEAGDIQNLNISCRVNGQTVQEANTSLMIFSVAHTISFISQLMTLEPGDIIATGTPAGVGFKRNPPVLLNHGDIVEVEIENIGTIRNPVVRNTASAKKGV